MEAHKEASIFTKGPPERRPQVEDHLNEEEKGSREAPNCFRCGKPSHQGHDCWKKGIRKDYLQQKCTKCKKPGHTQKKNNVLVQTKGSSISNTNRVPTSQRRAIGISILAAVVIVNKGIVTVADVTPSSWDLCSTLPAVSTSSVNGGEKRTLHRNLLLRVESVREDSPEVSPENVALRRTVPSTRINGTPGSLSAMSQPVLNEEEIKSTTSQIEDEGE
ncbi:hypothetical protein EGW08_023256 [Elysia chlorotica]|uniref:CCHC-type domain-containing protein n=1 Tax=Elysia chlorotica TaxID=188477 RepID=A0A433SJ52_ELYCH|nr:hypothetical protein EGW08_023256 [Elysia chlorotica]